MFRKWVLIGTVLSAGCPSSQAKLFDTVSQFSSYIDEQILNYRTLTKEDCIDIAKQINGEHFQLVSKEDQEAAHQDQNTIFKALGVLLLASQRSSSHFLRDLGVDREEKGVHEDSILETLLGLASTAKGVQEGRLAEYEVKVHRSIIGALFYETAGLDVRWILFDDEEDTKNVVKNYWRNSQEGNEVYTKALKKYGNSFQKIWYEVQVQAYKQERDFFKLADLAELYAQKGPNQNIEEARGLLSTAGEKALEEKNFDKLRSLGDLYSKPGPLQDIERAHQFLNIAGEVASEKKNFRELLEVAYAYTYDKFLRNKDKAQNILIQLEHLALEGKNLSQILRVAEFYAESQGYFENKEKIDWLLERSWKLAIGEGRTDYLWSLARLYTPQPWPPQDGAIAHKILEDLATQALQTNNFNDLEKVLEQYTTPSLKDQDKARETLEKVKKMLIEKEDYENLLRLARKYSDFYLIEEDQIKALLKAAYDLALKNKDIESLGSIANTYKKEGFLQEAEKVKKDIQILRQEVIKSEG